MVHLATALGNGEPNVAPIGAVYPRDTETVGIGNLFMKTTIRNVLENPRACLYVWGLGIAGCYKFKGNVEVKTEGKDYETMRDEVAKVKPGLYCRSLLVMKITEVYECMPGEQAGDRLILQRFTSGVLSFLRPPDIGLTLFPKISQTILQFGGLGRAFLRKLHMLRI